MADEYTEQTAPDIGDPTRRSFALNMIKNSDYIRTQVGTGNMGIFNGDFEYDLDEDDEPEGWTLEAYDGGAITRDADAPDTNAISGQASLRMDCTDTNGGGHATTASFIPAPPGGVYNLKWWMKSTLATLSNKVNVHFYDEDTNLISSEAVYDKATGNPTDWTLFARSFTTPADTRYMKVEMVGGVEDTNGVGSVFYDAVDFFVPERIESEIICNVAGTYTPAENVIGAHVWAEFYSSMGNPQFFGTMNTINYGYGYEFYEMEGGVGINYDADAGSKIYIISYGAVK